MPVIRLFIAIEISSEIQERLSETADQLKGHLKGLPLRWVPVMNIHLTLKFLGDVPVENLVELKSTLETEAASSQLFDITIGQLGVFPSFHRPRVIWTGIQAPETFYALQARIEQESRRLGYAGDGRQYQPHLTLARVSKNASATEIRRIGEVLQNQIVGTLGTFVVQTINLFRSDLQPGGAVYTRLYTAHLSSS